MSLFHSWALPAPLWADMNKFRNMGSQFRGPRAQVESDEIVTGTILLLALVVVIYILWRVAKRHERHGAYDSPRQLFQQLCKAHGLDRSQRRLLNRIVRHYRLTQPAQLFLEPARFEPANLGSQFAGDLAAVELVRQRLFAAADVSSKTAERTTSRTTAIDSISASPDDHATSPVMTASARSF